MAYPSDLDDWYGPSIEIKNGKVTERHLTRQEKEARYDEGLANAIEEYHRERRNLREQYRLLRQEWQDAQDLIDKGLMEPDEAQELQDRRDEILAAAQALKQQGPPTELPPPVPYEPPNSEPI